ncbi:MAG: YbfB/YjiJ family MFS transporter [Burkholderiaceae bacterium]
MPVLTAAGLLSLAAAMGIGRFAFTPVLPLMLRDGLLDVQQGGWLAAANYAGYFVGALTAARLPLRAGTIAVIALLATAGLTAAMAWPWAWAWLPLRFLAGVSSAWVFVATSIWCLGALARRGTASAAGFVYAGVGSGIAVTGLYCVPGATSGIASPALWLQLGGLALLMVLGVLLPAVWASLWTITGSAFLVGGTFMVITLAGVQEMRARGSSDSARIVGRITTAVTLGQIAGPVASSLLLHAGPHGLQLALFVGAAALLGTGTWLLLVASSGRAPMVIKA